MRGSAALNGMMRNQPRNGPQAACLVETEPRAVRLGLPALGNSPKAIRAVCRPSAVALNRRGWHSWWPRNVPQYLAVRLAA